MKEWCVHIVDKRPPCVFHLIKSVLEDDERGRVRGPQPPIERLEAEAVARGAVGELPGVTNRSGRQLRAQLGRETRREGREQH